MRTTLEAANQTLCDRYGVAQLLVRSTSMSMSPFDNWLWVYKFIKLNRNEPMNKKPARSGRESRAACRSSDRVASPHRMARDNASQVSGGDAISRGICTPNPLASPAACALLCSETVDSDGLERTEYPTNLNAIETRHYST